MGFDYSECLRCHGRRFVRTGPDHTGPDFEWVNGVAQVDEK